MVNSKFSYRAYIAFLMPIALLGGIISLSYDFYNNPFYEERVTVNLILISYLILVFIWSLLGELRNKFITVRVSKDEIIVSKLGGLLPRKKYKYVEIEYWKYSNLGHYLGKDQFLYLYHDGKKVAKISQFYHSNYSEIKKYIQETIKSQGYEKFRYIDEVKDIFR